MKKESYFISDTVKNIDEELYQIESEINWLHMLSPTHNDERWNCFKESNFKEVIPLEYPEIQVDFRDICNRLNALAFEKIENSLLHALLHEKKEELVFQIDLVEQRETEGFLSTSISLFGGSNPSLLELAKNILKVTPHEVNELEVASLEEVLNFTFETKKYYQTLQPDFDFKIHIVDDLNSSMMVGQGELYLAKSLHIPKNRIIPLIAHEVEVHIVTHYNGAHQPLKQLESGLAYYDSLQEGLASLSEFLTGNLPASRLRILAARVVAVNMALKGDSIKVIFSALYEEYKLSAEDAFDTAVRAKRGGGLTKDAVYLEGLSDLLSYLHAGEDLDMFFIGKFALNQRELLKKLIEENVLIPPKILPQFITSEEGRKQIQKLRTTSLTELFH